MRTRILTIIGLLCVFSLFIVSCSKKNMVKGSAENPIRLYYMPFKGKAVFDKYAPKLEQYIEANTGLSVESVYADNFVSIAEAFGKRKADVAFMNTLGYLMAHDWAKAEAQLLCLYGDVYTSYRGEILVRTDSGINSLKDLKGKTIAFADPFSASGYLYPLKLIHDKKVQPKKMVFAGGHLKAVEMLYDGKIDAIATYHTRPTITGAERDARIELIKEHPDIISKIKILALTDKIPNGPVAFSHTLPDVIKTKLVGAIMEFARTEKGRNALYNLYNITGFTTGNDSDYNGVRRVIKSLGKSVEEMIPGGVTFYKNHRDMWLQY